MVKKTEQRDEDGGFVRIVDIWRTMGSGRRELPATLVYLIFFAVGTLGHYLEATRGPMLTLTPGFLLVFGLSALIPLARERRWGVLVWGGVTFIVTFALEAIGVATGAVFGDYLYGPTLGLKLFGVPLIIGFNWVLVVLGSIIAVSSVVYRLDGDRRLTVRRVAVRIIGSLVVGALAVLFDLVLEPVAIRFDYWSWAQIAVPGQNYLAWFLISVGVSLPYFAVGFRVATRIPVLYVAVQFIFLASLLPLT